MLEFFLKKLSYLIITMFVLSLGVFMLAHFAPGDPLVSVYGETVERLTKEQKQVAIEKLGLNEPIYIQYIKWFENATNMDFGYSYKYKRPVLDVICTHLPNTMNIMGISLILTFVFSILLGVVAALNEGKFIDKLILKSNTLFYSIPAFWLSLIMILIFAVNLKILPSSGVYEIGKEHNVYNRILHMIMPITVVTIGHMGYYASFVRNKMIDELKEEYIVFAKAKGLSNNQIIFKHSLKKIMPSFIMLMSISLTHLIAGSFIVEYMFAYPGIGKIVFESAKYHDYPLLMGSTLLVGVIVVLASFIVDIISASLDPRIKERGSI